MFNRKNHINFFEKIKEIDDTLLKFFDIKIDHGSFKTNTTTTMIIILTYHFGRWFKLNFLTTIQIFGWSTGALVQLLINSFYYFLSIYSLIFIYGYVCYALLIYVRIKQLSFKIEEIVQEERKKVNLKFI